ncbi:ubiquitin-conjugating enzyme E2 U-like [Montipora capricornis]|uniref:ubiquitin-conjugating enzyme E2 U-like n=1 Tax=Montipora capricornis TaxID=246305 RepID=UPI0035F16FA4
MHSRAYMLLEKEWFKLQRENLPWGIQAKPLNEDDMFIWEGSIKGPKDTMWEGGIFKLYLQFGEQYNAEPPKIFFHTIPFHPNVDPITGQICADFLDGAHCWKEFYSISYMLLSVQMLLSNPVIDNAINPNAAQIFASSPSGFRQTVLDCVLASKRVEAGLKPHTADDIDLTRSPSKEQELPNISVDETSKVPRVGKVSFDDYHAMWSGLATTKPLANASNPLGEILRADSNLQVTHFGLAHQELQEEIHKQLTEHNAVMYGKFDGGKTGQDIAELKSNKIQMLKQIYLPKQQGKDSPSPRAVTSAQSRTMTTARDLDPYEKDVDELLAWTNTLP